MLIRTLLVIAATCGTLLGADSPGWTSRPDLVEKTGAKRPEFNYVETRVPKYMLPDVLAAPGGESAASTAEQWARNVRPKVHAAFEEHVYGRSPMPSKVTFTPLEINGSAMNGAATLKRVRISVEHEGRTFPIELVLFVPNKAAKPAPVFLLLNHRGPENIDPTRQEKSDFWPAEQVIARGYAVAAVQVTDVQADKKDKMGEGVLGFYGETERHTWGTLAAWAWAGSRALDYFETDKDVDAKRVAVLGHSRGGKTALWAGANDERFALTISNDSGCGGAALSRRRFGETLARINTSFPHWFAANFREYNGREDDLPIDQHQLMALMAPRAVYVASADEDLWADPRGEYLSLAHASPVFELYGFKGLKPRAMPPLDKPVHTERMGYHIRSGGHNLMPIDWGHYMDFADRLWGRGKS